MAQGPRPRAGLYNLALAAVLGHKSGTKLDRTDGLGMRALTLEDGGQNGHGKTKLVLVVDDHQAVLDSIRLLLEYKGFQVAAVSSGSEAVEFCKTHPGEILAVVTDMMMPQMDGPATIRALRQVDSTLKFIGISGVVDPSRLHDFSSLGLVTLLHKPFGMGEMMDALRDASATRAVWSH
jgi:CheY-like chemotaxis protein